MMRVRTNKITRLNSMKRSILFAALFVAIPAFAQQTPEIRFHSVPDFLKLPPDLHLGEATGVAVNSKGHIFVFTRGNSTGPAYGASAAQLLEFAPDGKFFREIGHHLYAWSFAHTVKVDKDGNWLKSWGEPGDQPGQFNTPHSIAVDAHDNIYVADRGNRRIQVFDTDGKFVRQFAIDVPVDPNARPAIGNKPATTTGTMAPGAPWAICITPPPNQVLYSSDGFPGRIYKLTLDGKVLGVFGKSGKQLGQFGWVHEIACPGENELYVAELLNWRVQKLILEAPH